VFRRVGAWIAIAAIAAVVVAELATSGSAGLQGRIAPPLPTAVLVGPRIGVRDLRGKPAAINFWASWCEPCRHEAPQLEKLWRSLHGRAWLVGVDYTDGLADARAFVRAAHLTYPILLDPNGVFGERYDVTGLPETAILDTHGRIVQVLRGPQTASTMRRALRQAVSGNG